MRDQNLIQSLSLEIYADDVKCSHGSTSGSLDKDSIYYLMTRGLSKKESTKIVS